MRSPHRWDARGEEAEARRGSLRGSSPLTETPGCPSPQPLCPSARPTGRIYIVKVEGFSCRSIHRTHDEPGRLLEIGTTPVRLPDGRSVVGERARDGGTGGPSRGEQRRDHTGQHGDRQEHGHLPDGEPENHLR